MIFVLFFIQLDTNVTCYQHHPHHTYKRERERESVDLSFSGIHPFRLHFSVTL